jgi:hypothetical protein
MRWHPGRIVRPGAWRAKKAHVAPRNRLAMRQNRTRSMRVGLTGLLVGIGRAGAVAICLYAWPAAAYRPFDGTDAAVAGLNEIEIELQPMGWQRIGSPSALIAPQVVFNYGFAERWGDADHAGKRPSESRRTGRVPQMGSSARRFAGSTRAKHRHGIRTASARRQRRARRWI